MTNEICSVVVPVFNGARYLEETIVSFLTQDYPAKELVLVDDASRDESLNILEEYQKRHPDLICFRKNAENQGPIPTYLSGIAVSKGVYIFPLSQDDVMFKNCLSTLIDAVQSCNVSMVCSNAYYLFGEKPSQSLVRPGSKWRTNRFIERYEFLFENPVIAASALFIKRDFDRVDKSLFQFRSAIEHILWFQFACMNGIYYLASPLVYYRQHQNQLSRTIFTTPEIREYRRFCRRHILSRLTVREILHALINHLHLRLKNAMLE